MFEHVAFTWLVRGLVCLLGAATMSFSPSAYAADGEEGWTLDPDARIELGFVSAETTSDDDQIVLDGEAFTLRTQAGLDLANENTRFRLEADRIDVVRLGEGRRDSARDRFTAMVQQKVGKDWEFELRARHYDDYVTAESNDTDEWQGAAMVTYEPVQAHRFRVQATWREREYDRDAGPATTGQGPRFDADYRYRFGRYHYLQFDLRTESIESDDPERGYKRHSAKVSYTQPITPDLRIRPAIEYLDTEFDGRIAPDGARRNDRLIVPEVEALWWPGKWRVEAEAKYIFTDSNEPARVREGYRVTLNVGYAF